MDPALMRMPIDQVLREIRMRTLTEGILTPNLVLLLTCKNPPTLELWTTRKILAGEQGYLQKMGSQTLINIPMAYKCPCGQTPCLMQGPTEMVDSPTLPILNWPLWKNKHFALDATMPPVFGVMGPV